MAIVLAFFYVLRSVDRLYVLQLLAGVWGGFFNSSNWF